MCKNLWDKYPYDGDSEQAELAAKYFPNAIAKQTDVKMAQCSTWISSRDQSPNPGEYVNIICRYYDGSPPDPPAVGIMNKDGSWVYVENDNTYSGIDLSSFTDILWVSIPKWP